VNVECPAPVVALGDAREPQVSVEDLGQLVRHVENREVGRQPRRDRLAVTQGLRLEAVLPLVKPTTQVPGQTVTRGDLVALPVLFVGGAGTRRGSLTANARRLVANFLAFRRRLGALVWQEYARCFERTCR
jgi:hypothetical protein